MNDFDYDNLQKKRVARGAFAHVNRKRGKCRLPSDYLTPAQRKEKNGEVKTYNIMRPMPRPEYQAIPDDMKREYMRNMQGFGGTAVSIARAMQISDYAVRSAAKRMGIPFHRGNGNAAMWDRKCAEWDAVSTPEQEPEMEPEVGPEPQNTTQGVTGATLIHARLVVRGDRASILTNIGAWLPDMCEVTVEW